MQVGQTWLLRGRTDLGREFQAELTLGPYPAEERRELEEGFKGMVGATQITAAFTGTQRGQEPARLVLLLTRRNGRELVMAMPHPSSLGSTVLDPADELSFCFLLPGDNRSQLEGVSLRLRAEGETYSITGTVGGRGDEREEVLATLRDALSPVFGVGDCTLTRR